jgi:hypothetical protein
VCGQDCDATRLIAQGMVCQQCCPEPTSDEIKAIDISSVSPQYLLLASVGDDAHRPC